MELPKILKDKDGELSLKKAFALVAGGAVLALAATTSPFTIQQSDMGNVRTLGKQAYDMPLEPGLHFKLPWPLAVADTVQTSLHTLHIPTFKVNTIDNQQITLDLNFNYEIPKGAVNHLLYGVGNSGNADIKESIIPIVMDRAGRVFNKQNTTTLSAQRDQIQAEVTQSVFTALKERFGILPHELQFAQIGYSPAFVASNEKAVTAKNDAIAERNRQDVEVAKAVQKVTRATADADAAIQNARGEAESILLNAKATKTQSELAGQGESSRLKAEIASFGSASLYVDYVKASKWDGANPQVMSGNGGGATVVVPMPTAKAPRP